jgi:histone-lysine N-methyltransferase SETMAR
MGPVNTRTAQFWFQRFKAGNEDLKDETRSGRPPVLDNSALAEFVVANRSATCVEIAEEFSCSDSAVSDHLQQLGFTKKLTKWVPHQLTEQQKLNRLQICNSLLLRHHNDPIIDCIITCDEKWVLFDNSRRSAEWMMGDEAVGTSPKRDLHPRRVMMTVWWTAAGIVHVDFLPNRATITAERYCDQLAIVHQNLLKTRSALVNRKGVLLLHDNARPHTAVRTREQLQRLGWEVLPHPAYSPDISPCDYYLFLSLTNFLANKNFSDEEGLKNTIMGFFSAKNAQFYRSGLERLVTRWQAVIAAGGDYFTE